jgi:hypothetical protein
LFRCQSPRQDFRIGKGMLVGWFHFIAERLGSGDGERKTLLTRQIASGPLPASVLLDVAAIGKKGRIKDSQ